MHSSACSYNAKKHFLKHQATLPSHRFINYFYKYHKRHISYFITII
ncbi:hypothetical protein [Moraxella lacunata]